MKALLTHTMVTWSSAECEVPYIGPLEQIEDCAWKKHCTSVWLSILVQVLETIFFAATYAPLSVHSTSSNLMSSI